MTKRERVLAALARRPVDRPPVAFWRHAPDVDDTARGLADAMLAFHKRWDLDLIKVMSSGVYCVEDWGCRVAYTGAPNGAKQCVEHAVKSRDDWARIGPLDHAAGALGRELHAVRLISRVRGDDAPVLHTVFSPLTVARKLAGDRLVEDLRADAGAVLPALEAIADTMARHARAALEAGADGIFFATQMASREMVTEDEYRRFGTPFDRQVLDAIADQSSVTLLHAHGRDIFFSEVAAQRIHAINWHDRVTAPTLAQAKRRFAGAVVGGLAEWTTLLKGPADAVVDEVRDAIRQTSGVGLIVGPGCVLPLAAPDSHLQAVVDAIRSPVR
jgi:uroporphyrinogen decarboxylase